MEFREALLEEPEAMNNSGILPDDSISPILEEAWDGSVVSSPLAIDTKQICAFCEKPYDFIDARLKTMDMKRVEEIGLEHFKRRVLMLKEESFAAIALCDSCIFSFVKNEKEVLESQLKYLEMSEVGDMEKVFNDPLADFKRIAISNLKSEEPVIRRKLEVLEKFSASGDFVLCEASPTSTPFLRNGLQFDDVQVYSGGTENDGDGNSEILASQTPPTGEETDGTIMSPESTVQSPLSNLYEQ